MRSLSQSRGWSQPGATNYTYKPRGHGKFSLLPPLLLRSHKFPYCDMETEITDVNKLHCVTGCIAKKTISHTVLADRSLQLFVDEKSHTYFDLINRAGLTFPSNFLFIVTQLAYLIFNVCISTLETEFLQFSRQKQTYLGGVERFIIEHEGCTDIHSICDSCEATQLKVITFLERRFFIVSEQKNRQKITNKCYI